MMNTLILGIILSGGLTQSTPEKPKKPRRIRIEITVQEPSLEQLKSLGFIVCEQMGNENSDS